MIYVRTLGPAAVEIDGVPGPPELLWRKHLALTVYLARSPRRTRSRDHLVNLLWGDRPEEAARHSLNEALRLLRKYGGERAVESSADQVTLADDDVRLDCDVLTRKVEEEDWAGAAELVVGEFMEGFAVPGTEAFEEWLESERGIWRRAGVEALAHAAALLQQAGHHGEGIRLAHRASTLDPHSTVAIQAEMRALTLGGHSTTALERFSAFTERLSRDLDSPPDIEATKLAERIRGSMTQKRMKISTGVTPDAMRELPFVGRDTQLARCLDALGSCRATPCATLILVDGEAGAGKTRFLEALSATTSLEGTTCILARAVEGDADVPWSAVCGLARGGMLSAPGAVAAPPGAFAALAALDPVVADLVAAAPPADVLPVVVAVRELLRAATDEGPVLLALDDAQWLDPESLQALETVLRDLAGQPLSLVLAVRTPLGAPSLDELRSRVGRDVEGIVVTLGPLPVNALADLARFALPSYAPDELDRVVRRIAADSAGSPLFADELLQAISAGLDLGRLPEAWPVPFRTMDQTFPADLPDAVVAAVRVNFRRLSGEAQGVLAAASMLPDRIVPADVARATGVSAAELEPVLDELERQRWLVADSRGYGFVARLVRAVVSRDMLTGGQRRRIEERLTRDT